VHSRIVLYQRGDVNMNEFKTAIEYFPYEIRNILKSISDYDSGRVQEIRLRVNRNLNVTINGSEYTVLKNGSISRKNSNGVLINQDIMNETFNSLCEYSIHSYEESLINGYITIKGGCRVGFGASCSMKNGIIESIKYINSINIRIANQILNCSDIITNLIYKEDVSNTLIAGPVSSGKTTILRDICRKIGKNKRISLIDERNEIACCFNGVPQSDIGNMTDVLEGYNRSDGIEIALRTLTPDIIVCDEIFNTKDAHSIIKLYGNGVKIITTTHASSIKELKEKEVIRRLIAKKIFKYVVVLDSKENIGKIKEFTEIK
jgi:stage III sporulation protein AA